MVEQRWCSARLGDRRRHGNSATALRSNHTASRGLHRSAASRFPVIHKPRRGRNNATCRNAASNSALRHRHATARELPGRRYCRRQTHSPVRRHTRHDVGRSSANAIASDHANGGSVRPEQLQAIDRRRRDHSRRTDRKRFAECGSLQHHAARKRTSNCTTTADRRITKRNDGRHAIRSAHRRPLRHVDNNGPATAGSCSHNPALYCNRSNTIGIDGRPDGRIARRAVDNASANNNRPIDVARRPVAPGRNDKLCRRAGFAARGSCHASGTGSARHRAATGGPGNRQRSLGAHNDNITNRLALLSAIKNLPPSSRSLREGQDEGVRDPPASEGAYQPITIFDSITLRACSRSAPVSCI